MWAMEDTDRRDVAEHFYMFSGGDESIPYYERSAKVLLDAVQKLRREEASGYGTVGQLCTLWGMIAEWSSNVSCG